MDTARVYAGGTSEEYLGQIDHKARGLKIETKLIPFKVHTRCPLHISLPYSSLSTIQQLGMSHDPEVYYFLRVTSLEKLISVVGLEKESSGVQKGTEYRVCSSLLSDSV